MAGKVVVSTLNDDTGVLATQNGMTGIARAWCFIVGGTSPTASTSFNVSSITYLAAGDYQVNFTTAMPSTNYVPNANDATNAGRSGIYARPTSTSACRIVINGGFNDDIAFVVHSS